MKIIELLNRIAKGEEVPKGIEHNGDLYLWEKNDKTYYSEPNGADLMAYIDIPSELNDEVKIIKEEKEIEFDNFSGYTYNVGRVDESNIEKYIHTLFSQQMRLIENQKKIINVINDMRDKE